MRDGVCQISWRSVKPLPSDGAFSIFRWRPYAILDLLFLFGPPTKSMVVLSLWKIWLESMQYKIRYHVIFFKIFVQVWLDSRPLLDGSTFLRGFDSLNGE